MSFALSPPGLNFPKALSISEIQLSIKDDPYGKLEKFLRDSFSYSPPQLSELFPANKTLQKLSDAIHSVVASASSSPLKISSALKLELAFRYAISEALGAHSSEPQFSDIRADLDSLLIEKGQLQAEVTELRDEKEAQNKLKDERQNEIKGMEDEIAHLRARERSLQEQISSISRSSAAELSREKARSNLLSEKAEDSSTRLSISERTIEDLQRQLKNASDENEGLSNQITELHQKVLRKSEKLRHMRTQKADAWSQSDSLSFDPLIALAEQNSALSCANASLSSLCKTAISLLEKVESLLEERKQKPINEVKKQCSLSLSASSLVDFFPKADRRPSLVQSLPNIQLNPTEELKFFSDAVAPIKGKDASSLFFLREEESFESFARSLRNILGHSETKSLAERTIDYLGFSEALIEDISTIFAAKSRKRLKELPSLIASKLCHQESEIKEALKALDAEKSERKLKEIEMLSQINEAAKEVATKDSQIYILKGQIASLLGELEGMNKQIEVANGANKELQSTFSSFNSSKDSLQLQLAQAIGEKDQLEQLLRTKSCLFDRRLKDALENERRIHKEEVDRITRRLAFKEESFEGQMAALRKEVKLWKERAKGAEVNLAVKSI